MNLKFSSNEEEANQSLFHVQYKNFPDSSTVKNLPANAGDLCSIPGSGRSWGRKWQTTPVFLPGKSHGQRSLVDYSPWGRKESDTT